MNLLARKDKAILNEKERSLIAHYQPKSPVAEQYRTIRTNIQYAALQSQLRTIVVTSTGPGEGKSTTVANLAVVMAQQGKKVLLIDADMRKPTAHFTFRQANRVGLTNVLTKQTSLEAAVAQSDVENLDILTSGPVPPNPAELLGSSLMDSLLNEVTNKYDIVLIDTPPVIAVTDAQILSNKCDGAVLVIGSGKTIIDEAKKAKELLEHANAKLLGVVLNRKEQKQSQYYYYYGEK